MPVPARPTQTSGHAMPILLAGLFLGLGFFVYGSTGHDDSHINFWNVYTLLTRGELVNYNGERVEQTTSLLQVFLTALLSQLLPIHLVTLGYWVDIASAFFACLLGMQIARQMCVAQASWMPLLTMSSASFLLWSFGGMGAPLTALCLLWAIQCWWRWITDVLQPVSNAAALILVTTALMLVRPEMPVVATAITAAIAIASWLNDTWRVRAILLFTFTATAALLLFIWQHWYFGSWLPIPAIAKQGGDLGPQLWRGARYWLLGSLHNPMLPFAMFLSIPLLWQFFRQWLQGTLEADGLMKVILLAVMWGYGGFVWTAGGDWMQAGRFFVPIVIPAALVLLLVLHKLNRGRIVQGLLIALVAMQFGVQYQQIANASHGIPVWVQTRITAEHVSRYSTFEQLNQEHVRDMTIIEHMAELVPPLHEKLGRPVLLMSGQAGMVFYYTASQFFGQVQFRDLRGLVESSLTLCPALKNIPRSPQGLNWGYRDFFAQLPTLEKECGIKPPDIIYDLNGMDQKLGKTLDPLGYTMLHQETGYPVVNSTGLPYNRLLTPNMIFVRTEWLPLLGNPEKRIINYRDLPLHTRWPMQAIID